MSISQDNLPIIAFVQKLIFLSDESVVDNNNNNNNNKKKYNSHTKPVMKCRKRLSERKLF